MNARTKTAFRAVAFSAAALTLTACGAADRLANVGKPPALSGIENPQAQAGYQPVRMPMPAPMAQERQANSLWRAGARAFFKDQRAGQVGDILTVLIQIDDSAEMENTTARSRSGEESMGVPSLFGLENNIARKLNTDGSDTLLNVSGGGSSTGNGTIERSEQIELKVAALITQVLPNGNLVVQGKQEVRVNYEVRELLISGVIRPEDINSQNTIGYEKIAEARISYGGRGHITDVQQPRYGQQIIDIISPF
ncbi:MAG TPA: flagellar basal body L-ring protein FlgH [Azospirillaceae bacterium]|nr:flagellar basal body L-ring protein FlgH [Azospirillaceae bacterium]